jgi:hypothetical protein
MVDAARNFSKRVAPDESRVLEAKYKVIKDLHSPSLEMSKLFRARNSTIAAFLWFYMRSTYAARTQEKRKKRELRNAP